MPSPLWTDPPTPMPIAQAIAAAVHAGWDAPDEERGLRTFLDTLRKLVGPELYENIHPRAFRIWQLQPRAPDGYERRPPTWAWLGICPRCQSMKRTPHTVPQNGRLELQVLRDPEWLARQLERHGENRGAIRAIARSLGVNTALVAYWMEKHGLRSPWQNRRDDMEPEARRRHAAGEGPGLIARELETSTMQVRRILKRLGLATRKNGMVYHAREWWRVRLEDRRMTKLACAREAGIKPHAANYWIRKFDLEHAVDPKRRRKRRYPELQDPEYLRDLLARHDRYSDAAAEVGCQPSLVSFYARKILGVKRQNSGRRDLPHGKREWWESRLEKGMTFAEMAEEAGVAEKTAKERLRIFGLLARGYENEPGRNGRSRARRQRVQPSAEKRPARQPRAKGGP